LFLQEQIKDIIIISTPALPERLSSMGYVFIINNGAVSWRSTRNPLVTLSAAKSEVVALSADTQEAVYLRKIAMSRDSS
jgi:hypothetical protein